MILKYHWQGTGEGRRTAVEDSDLARVRRELAADEVKQRRFSGSAPPHDRDHSVRAAARQREFADHGAQYGKDLYQYADLIRLVPRLDATAFSRATQILDNYNLVAGGYYALKHLVDFGVKLPPYVQEFLHGAGEPPDGADPIEINDLGDVWPKLWGRR